jgi:hypothetical protein
VLQAVTSVVPQTAPAVAAGTGPLPFRLATRPVEIIDGTVPYVTGGGPGTPLKIRNTKLLARLELETNLTVQFTQPAGAAAPTFYPEGPMAILGVLDTSYSAADDPIQAHAWLLAILHELQYPAAPLSITAPLPAANSGTQQVVTNESWSFVLPLDIVFTMHDLEGLILMANRNVLLELVANFAPENSVMVLPNGTTASASGTVTVRSARFEVPQPPNEMPDLTQLHIVREYPNQWTSSGDVLIDLPRNFTYARIIIAVLEGGHLDTTNAGGLTRIQLRYGETYTQYNYSPNVLINRMQERYERLIGGNAYQNGLQQIPGGVYVLDLTDDWPRDAIDASQLSDFQLILSFTNAPPANSTIVVAVEQIEDLVPSAQVS